MISYTAFVKTATRKQRQVLSNDDLLYDPQIDEDNEQWVKKQRMRYQPGKWMLRVYVFVGVCVKGWGKAAKKKKMGEKEKQEVMKKRKWREIHKHFTKIWPMFN